MKIIIFCRNNKLIESKNLNVSYCRRKLYNFYSNATFNRVLNVQILILCLLKFTLSFSILNYEILTLD